jgi:hypothetical protein
LLYVFITNQFYAEYNKMKPYLDVRYFVYLNFTGPDMSDSQHRWKSQTIWYREGEIPHEWKKTNSS